MTDIKEAGSRLNLQGLPQNILDQLKGNKLDDMEKKILDVLTNLYSGLANIDEIIVGMFRTYGVIKTRDYYVGKLYKMAKDEIILSVEKKKGVYETLENKKLRENVNNITNSSL